MNVVEDQEDFDIWLTGLRGGGTPLQEVFKPLRLRAV